MGKELAEYLVEHLPFETEPAAMIETVRLVLQPGLLDVAAREELWKRGERKNTLRVGFLIAGPDDLPKLTAARHDAVALGGRLGPLAGDGNAPAKLLLRLVSGAGQAFLAACDGILKKPVNQDVVNAMLDVIAGYFAAVRPEGPPDRTIEELCGESDASLRTSPVRDCLNRAPELEREFRAMRILSGLSYAVIRPVLSGSTAAGSLMRRKLEPVMSVVLEQIRILQGR